MAQDLANGNANFSALLAGIPGTATCIKETVEDLLRSGFKSVIVSNIQNIGIQPIWKSASAGASASQVQQLLGGITVLVNTLNELIESHVSELALKYSGGNRKVATFDMYSLYYRLLRDGPAHLGLTNITDACLQVNPWYTPSGDPGNTVLGTCRRPSDYVFWDYSHPSTATHRYLATYIQRSLMQHSNIFLT
jgi:phospholipase/lecithinase/hemolysin